MLTLSRTLRHWPLLFLGQAALLTVIAHAADNATSATVKFTDPAKPGALKIYIGRGDLKVRGGDVDTISVRSTAEPEKSKRADGLRVISTASSFSLTEKDNVASLDYGKDAWPTGGSADFDVVVPRNTTLTVTNGWGGDIQVEAVDGDVEIKTMNSEVKLTELGGGALVETMNGEITASFSKLPEGKALSFTSMNGEIALHLPASAKANVRFRSQNGAILTDFDEKELVTKTEALAGSRTSRHASEIARQAAEVAREAAQAAREVAEEVSAAVAEELSSADARAQARAEGRADNGSRTRAPRPPRAPMPPSIPALAGGKVVSGTLNGGGAEIQAATMNGDITIRKTGG